MNVAQIGQSYELRDERLEFTPDNFLRPLDGITTASEIDVEQSLNYFSGQTLAWGFRAHGKKLCPVVPVTVSIRQADGFYLAENENLRIFVAGDSLDEAMQAFAEQVVHFYEHYMNLAYDKVTGEAHRLKGLYDNCFFVEEKGCEG